ncbi:MAG: spermidine/putrescine ABC transporter substrate-binding protein [SAR324 cluster bacterium]|nr:spermidine/putrescine ABC transporter substrate-binding protein [SAR324 cluster bacterium]
MKKTSNYSRRKFIATTGITAAALTIGSKFSAFGAESKRINFMNWDTYIGPNTFNDFKKALGVTVKLDLFANNDELFGKLQNGNPGYDVIVPSHDMVQKMTSLNMLVPLNYDKIPNSKNIFKKFQDAEFDPGRKHSITYMWGTIGIGYNKRKVKGTPDSWKFLYDSPLYANRISLIGEARDLIALGLKYLGYSANSTNLKHLAEVEKLLIAQKKHIKSFHSDNGQDLLLANEIDLVQEYSGDISQIMAEDKKFDYLVPKEGSTVWQDNLAIPKGAPNLENAHKFINFLLDAKIGRDIADEIRYATPNEAAYKLMDDKYRNDPTIYPPDNILKRCETLKFHGLKMSQKYDEILTRIKAA